MKFAVVGNHPDVLTLCQQIAQSSQHQFGAFFLTDDALAVLSDARLPMTLAASAEEVSVAPEQQVVIVAWKDCDRSLATARQALQAGHAVICLPPDDVSTAYSYELHLLLDEHKSGAVPLTGRWYLQPPGVNAPAESNSSIEGIRQFTLDLPLPDDPVLQSRMELMAIDAVSTVASQADIRQLQIVVVSQNPFGQVTALDIPGTDGRPLTRSLTLAAHVDAERSVAPAVISFRRDPAGSSSQPSDVDSEMSTAAVTVRATMANGEVRAIPVDFPITVPADRSQVQSSSAEARTEENQKPPHELDLPSRLLSVLDDESACQALMGQFSSCLELAAGVEKSRRRRRTVDVYFDGISERSAFKTQMTAIGCGILTYVIFGMIGFLMIAQIASLPPIVLQIGRALWIAPVVIFLLAQLLLPLARERNSEKTAAKSDARSSQSP
ncbi:MAG: hypothetical protein KDA81_21065 [Planctomycetaceae bacterium]|nr:hypothetical protein [Planctomycetaceae bacterium]